MKLFGIKPQRKNLHRMFKRENYQVTLICGGSGHRQRGRQRRNNRHAMQASPPRLSPLSSTKTGREVDASVASGACVSAGTGLCGNCFGSRRGSRRGAVEEAPVIPVSDTAARSSEVSRSVSMALFSLAENAPVSLGDSCYSSIPPHSTVP